MSGAPINIGTIESLTGTFGSPISSKITDAWVKWTNAHGGINGHPVKVTLLDDGSSATADLTDAKQLVEQNHVLAIVGANISVTQAFVTYIGQAKVPLIGGNAGQDPGNQYFFPASTSLLSLGPAIWGTAKQLGSTKWGNMYCAESVECSQGVPYLHHVASTMGATVSYAGAVSATAVDYTAPCLSMISAGTTAATAALGTPTALNVAETCQKQGYKGIWVDDSVSPSWSSVRALDGARIYVINNVWPWQDHSMPGQQAYVDAINQYAPGLQADPGYSNFTQYIWVSMEMFKAAAEAAQVSPSSTSADVLNGLYQLNGSTLGGLLPPITFSSSATAQTDKCYWVSELVNGSWVDQFGGQPQCPSS